jgi:hypothetical protein
MADWALKILVVAFVGWVIWSILQPRFAFEIRIEDGRARLRKGKVTQAFVDSVAEICRDAGVGRGWIGGVLNGRRTALRFSREFPPGVRQRLRNEWQAAG